MATDPSQLFDPLAILKAVWPIFKPVAIVILAISMIRVALTIIKWTQLMRAGMPEIDRMTGRDFEEKISFLMESRGYRVQVTPYVGDWGADLVLSRDGRRTVAQLKRWKRRIGVTAVQEVVAAKGKYKCESSMIIANSYFTRAARELARANNVELWDRDRLASELIRGQAALMLASSPPARSQPEQMLNAAPPRCTRCGREMVRRKGRYGEFWGCSGFPKCRNTQPRAGQLIRSRQGH